MKINSRIAHSPFVPTPHHAVRKLLSTAAADPPMPTILDIAERTVSPELAAFFAEQYLREAPKDSSQDALTSDEDSIVSYMTGSSFESPFVICGHAGTGKTTLLLYITMVLCLQRPKLKERVLPIYISLSDTAAAIADLATFDELAHHLREEVIKRSSPTLLRAFCDFPAKTLRWIREHSDTMLRGKFGSSDEKAAERDPSQWLARQSDRVRDAIFWDFLLFYTATIQPIVVVLDNVDRFSRDVHVKILSFGDQLRNYRIGCVASMRHSTYKELDLLISEKRDPSLCLELRADVILSVFKTRLDHAHRRVASSDLTGEDLETLSWLVDLLNHSRSTQLLAGVAGQNLHRIGKNFDRMARSHYLQADLVRRARSRDPEAHLALVHSALFGNYHGAFKADKESATAGIINLFCGMQGIGRPYSAFCRLQLLARLRREERVNPGHFVHDYCGIFSGEMNAYRVVLRSLLQLITGGLVTTSRCRKIADIGDVERVIEDMSDGFQIAPSGDFYLSTLIYRSEYLYFMKDDVEFREDIDLGYTVLNEGDSKKGDAIARFVRELAKLEREMWFGLRGTKLKNGENALRAYNERFSARGLAKKLSTASFALSIWSEIEQNVSELAPGITRTAIGRDLTNSLTDLVRAEADLELT